MSDNNSFAEAVYENLAPLAYSDADLSFALLNYVEAIGQMLQDVDYLAHDDTAPWRKILSLDEIPDDALPWLGQFIGVQVDPNLTPDQQRQQIRSHQGWQRGTVTAFKNSIRYLLSGTRTVEVVERYPDAYSFSVSTYDSETFSSETLYTYGSGTYGSGTYGGHANQTYQDYYNDYATYQAFYEAFDSYASAWLFITSNLIQAILNANKPAGLTMTYSILPGSPGTLNSYATIFIKYNSSNDMYIADQTYEDVYFEV